MNFEVRIPDGAIAAVEDKLPPLALYAMQAIATEAALEYLASFGDDKDKPTVDIRPPLQLAF